MPLVREFILTGDTTTGTTAAEILGSAANGLRQYDWFTIDASLKGVPLGTLDVYLQRKVTSDVWADWLHFPQLAAGAARIYYSVPSASATDIRVVGWGTDASPGTPTLAANTFVGGHPGDMVRLVAKQGSATMTGTGVTVRLQAWQGLK